jgi:hypothetical protein
MVYIESLLADKRHDIHFNIQVCENSGLKQARNKKKQKPQRNENDCKYFSTLRKTNIVV